MAQFDIYRNASREGARRFPYLLEVQSKLLSDLDTRVVIPLVEAREFKQPITRLHPQLDVEGRDYVLLAAQMAGTPKTSLGQKVGNLSDRRDDIIAAIDILITGL